jgi:hypothetical protein
MLPFYIDINPNQDASTTINKDKTEISIQSIPTYFDNDILKWYEFMKPDLVSVFTTISLFEQLPLEYEYTNSIVANNFDLISKFEFKESKKIKGRLVKSFFAPPIFID